MSVRVDEDAVTAVERARAPLPMTAVERGRAPIADVAAGPVEHDGNDDGASLPRLR